MKYRPEVDGLRAVAVIPVILFHASPTLLSGGFLGVDVFFVISGFLITALLLEDMAAGRAHWGSAVHPKVNYYFTFSRFWELFLGSLGAFTLRYRQLRARPVLAGIG